MTLKLDDDFIDCLTVSLVMSLAWQSLVVIFLLKNTVPVKNQINS